MPKKTNKRRLSHKTVLGLPDLDHAKSSVLNSLSSPRSRRNYKQRERLRRLNGGGCSLERTALQPNFPVNRE